MSASGAKRRAISSGSSGAGSTSGGLLWRRRPGAPCATQAPIGVPSASAPVSSGDTARRRCTSANRVRNGQSSDAARREACSSVCVSTRSSRLTRSWNSMCAHCAWRTSPVPLSTTMPKKVAARSRPPLGHAGARSAASSSTSHTTGIGAPARRSTSNARRGASLTIGRPSANVTKRWASAGSSTRPSSRWTMASPLNASAANWFVPDVTRVSPARRVST